MHHRRLLSAGLLLLSSLTHAEEPAWVNTLDRIASGVVSIRVDSTRAFDTEWNSSSQATGFVVDAERGIVLTNRHVVTPGPVVAEAVFRNNEEVRLTPIYRDPVHDFGFFRYNPDDLQYIDPAELALAPGAAGIGREIRVVGNDAGEQLSILAGTIARLDRQAPDYGRGKYNDFNTFYYQAASGTSGGSSGSPVINIAGDVVALNAGGANSAASSFFLPLDRIDRALKLIQNGAPVSRGSLQTEFVRRTYDELRRLGLTESTESLVRSVAPDLTGMLTVQQIIAGSPADGKLAPGDILLRINDELVTEFVPLAGVLDGHVGESITVEVERGGRHVVETLPVTDLHAISPNEYFQFGDAIVNNLSYQQARHYNRPLNGVYIANPGYIMSKSAIPRGAVITEFGGTRIRTLDDLETVVTDLADRQRTTIRYNTIEDPRNSIVRSVEMDRTWFPARRCSRDDRTGVWPCRDLEPAPERAASETGSTRFPPYDDSRVETISRSLVVVNFDMPYTVSGVAERHYYGTGLIVDAERGLVVVDRNTVPVAMGDVSVTFAGSLEVRGKVEYIHPLHNLAVVSYDPATIGDTPVRSASLNTATPQPGEDIWVVGLKPDHQLVHQKSIGLFCRPAKSAAVADAQIQRRQSREHQFGERAERHRRRFSRCAWPRGGDVVEFFRFRRGTTRVSSIAESVATWSVSSWISCSSGRPLYSLEMELAYSPLFAARKLGLDDTWLERLEAHDPKGRRALTITRLVAGSPASQVLQNGDMVLAIDDSVVSSYREFERAAQKPRVRVTVWRDGKEQEFDIDTVALDGAGIGHAVMWAGRVAAESASSDVGATRN